MRTNVIVIVCVLVLLTLFAVATILTKNFKSTKEGYGGPIKDIQNIRQVPMQSCNNLCLYNHKKCMDDVGPDSFVCTGILKGCLSECYYSKYRRF